MSDESELIGVYATLAFEMRAAAERAAKDDEEARGAPASFDERADADQHTTKVKK